jgi:hypothetical protein
MLALLPNYKFKDVIDTYSAGTVVYENKMMIGEHHDTPA